MNAVPDPPPPSRRLPAYRAPRDVVDDRRTREEPDTEKWSDTDPDTDVPKKLKRPHRSAKPQEDNFGRLPSTAARESRYMRSRDSAPEPTSSYTSHSMGTHYTYGQPQGGDLAPLNSYPVLPIPSYPANTHLKSPQLGNPNPYHLDPYHANSHQGIPYAPPLQGTTYAAPLQYHVNYPYPENNYRTAHIPYMQSYGPSHQYPPEARHSAPLSVEDKVEQLKRELQAFKIEQVTNREKKRRREKERERERERQRKIEEEVTRRKETKKVSEKIKQKVERRVRAKIDEIQAEKEIWARETQSETGMSALDNKIKALRGYVAASQAKEQSNKQESSRGLLDVEEILQELIESLEQKRRQYSSQRGESERLMGGNPEGLRPRRLELKHRDLIQHWADVSMRSQIEEVVFDVLEKLQAGGSMVEQFPLLALQQGKNASDNSDGQIHDNTEHIGHRRSSGQANFNRINLSKSRQPTSSRRHQTATKRARKMLTPQFEADDDGNQSYLQQGLDAESYTSSDGGDFSSTDELDARQTGIAHQAKKKRGSTLRKGRGKAVRGLATEPREQKHRAKMAFVEDETEGSSSNELVEKDTFHNRPSRYAYVHQPTQRVVNQPIHPPAPNPPFSQT